MLRSLSIQLLPEAHCQAAIFAGEGGKEKGLRGLKKMLAVWHEKEWIMVNTLNAVRTHMKQSENSQYFCRIPEYGDDGTGSFLFSSWLEDFHWQ